MVVAQKEIWNTTLLFGLWISISLTTYLFANLITVQHPLGLLHRECALAMVNAILHSWVLYFVALLALFLFGMANNKGVISFSQCLWR